MPPKPKFTKEEIVAAALQIVSESGAEALTARELGARLGSSARPIFTVFSGMKELQSEVRAAAMKIFEGTEVSGMDGMPVFKRIGVKTVLFGVREPKLYKLLFMSENENAFSFDDIFAGLGSTAVKCIEAVERDYSLNEEQARTLFENMWIYTFGIGALCATGACRFPEDKLGQMLTAEFNALMLLIKNSAS